MRNGTLANMYSSNRIYSSAVTKGTGLVVSAHHNGKNIAIQAKPIPPVADYERWFYGGNRSGGGKITPAKIRRIVIMRRQGSSWKECGDAVGISGCRAREWIEFLPFDLAV
jgi:hypothetical protein